MGGWNEYSSPSPHLHPSDDLERRADVERAGVGEWRRNDSVETLQSEREEDGCERRDAVSTGV